LFLTINQSHEKAQRFITKAFPCYEQIVELCDVTMATGAGAFRGMVGTDEGWSEQDAHGSKGDAGAREETVLGRRMGQLPILRCFMLVSGGLG